ncbi:MAG: polysaccharide biosynthesis protein [Clostridiales bacterium]|nr:polysaccharide biosynthesis protein [Clostridiales bacterium]
MMIVLAAFVSYGMLSWAKAETFSFSIALLWWIVFNIVLLVSIFSLLGLYSMVFASVSILDAMKLCFSVAMIAAANVLFVFLYGRENGIGYSVALIYVVLIFFASSAIRFAKRAWGHIKRITHAQTHVKTKKNVMIVGGGEAGLALVKEMISSDKSNYQPVCIIDDNKHLQDKKIYDVRVAGTTKDILSVAEKYQVEEIFVAMPSVEKKIRSAIIQRCGECGCPVKVLPGMYQLANGQVTVSKLRHVEIQDLLGREQVKVDLDEVMRYIQNKVVLVTGGGGSIGSELCRQVASHNPKELIILDIYENNAYEIEQELKRKYPDLKLLTLIASIRDKNKIRDVFDKYRPQIVFNAAAHKHVPLMETSPNEAVKNNVFGTLNVAKAADEYGVETFVQISTDKAVNPTNIMGATKRICEMIIQTIGKYSKNTNFVAVRFGNVLGSNGSVIPLFKKQIAEGGPVTVTHKDIIRYFMTIPEAVSLVLQAGAYAKGGQIFVLDMGEPVRIYDLAYNLIKLSGYEPNVDIKIECTGLRPGEKLYEERLMKEEGLQKTANGLINIARPIPMDEENLWDTLDKLYEAAYSETDSMKEWVKELVPTYTIDKRESVAISFMKSVAKQNEEVEKEAIEESAQAKSV